MDALLLPLAASLAAVALSVSVVSLAIHWVRRHEHPDVSRCFKELHALRGDLAELWDKFDHQVKRDRVRRLRASKEQAQEAQEEPTELNWGVGASKADLRSAAAQVRLARGR